MGRIRAGGSSTFPGQVRGGGQRFDSSRPCLHEFDREIAMDMRTCEDCGKTWNYDCPDCEAKDRLGGYLVGAILRSSVDVQVQKDSQNSQDRVSQARADL